MKRNTIILIIVLVAIVVVALVVYFTSKQKNAPVTTSQGKTQTGLANLFSSGGGFGSLIGLFGGGGKKPTGNASNSPVTGSPTFLNAGNPDYIGNMFQF